MANHPPSAADEPDPSMDDILASIRRILDDDQANKAPDLGVLMLDPSMMVAEPGTEPDTSTPPLAGLDEKEETEAVIDDQPALQSVSRETPAPTASSLVAPEAAAAAANSVGSLMRTLAAERNAIVSRGGITIEDLVREEMRPLLKSWLDTHLPPIVERLVQAEIERVVARHAG